MSTEDKDNNYQQPGNQPDEYVKCPYFPEHELRRSRLPYHLQKCQKNPMAPDLVACPYNYMHRIRKEDREDHLIFCEDKVRFKYRDRKPASYSNTLKEHFKITDQKSLINMQKEKAKEQKLNDGSVKTNGESSEANDEEWW